MSTKRLLFLGWAAVLADPEGGLTPRVIPSLLKLAAAGYELVIVANGTVDPATLRLFASQGVEFQSVLTCAHPATSACLCRKPHLGLVRPLLTAGFDQALSAVVGADGEDEAFAGNLGLPFLRVGGELTWPEIAARLLAAPRTARVTRRTAETDIDVAVDLDGAAGAGRIATGLGFFDHMLAQLSRHGGFALDVSVSGDLDVDEHHTVEDTALALGEALRRALGDRRGLERYGFVLPMDEALASAALDLSGRPYAVMKAAFPRETVGELPTELVPHFFTSLAQALGATLHVEVRGDNAHHMVEGAFKAVARTLRQAVRRTGRRLRAVDERSLMIAVVDTGGANLRSVTNALARLGADAVLTSDAAEIRRADRVVLPGVGAAASAMERLAAAGLTSVLPELTQPVLGICLGMQLLFEGSDEGDAAGLGLIPGRVTRLVATEDARVPHMGWNDVVRTQADDPLLAGLDDDACFYFVHGYRAPDGPWVTAVTRHGGDLPAVVAWRNVRGVQFHPEKSQAAGQRLLENFLKL